MFMDKKSWKESKAELQRIVLPPDTNVLNGLYGGRLVEWIDNLASIVAFKHALGPAVTGSIDDLYFVSPINLGDIVLMQGRINHVTRTTMEIEVNVFAEDFHSGIPRFATEAYLTYVAIDANRKPKEVPGLLLETEDDRRRFAEGEKRSNLRKERLKGIREESKKFIQCEWESTS